MLKILELYLFCLSMLVASCFYNLFSYKIPLHRKWVRLKCAGYLILDAALYSTLIHMRASINYQAQLKGIKEKHSWEITHVFLFQLFFFFESRSFVYFCSNSFLSLFYCIFVSSKVLIEVSARFGFLHKNRFSISQIFPSPFFSVTPKTKIRLI